jgi:MFS superfamily sulfate permease-like transporter
MPSPRMNIQMKKADLIAGLSVAGLMLPEAVAYAAIAGLPPQRAIFAGIAGCLAYLILGQSRFAIVSPTSSSAAILAAILLAVPIAPEQKAALATAAVLLTGVFFVLAGLARLGGLTGLIARPVLRGFAFGLAITIIIKQLPTVVGVEVHASTIFGTAEGLITQIVNWNSYSIASGVIALAALLLMRRLPAIPGAFITLAAGIGASVLLDLPAHGVATVGAIDTALSLPSIPNFTFQQWSNLAQLTLPLAMILFAESWGTISALALRHGDSVNANREITALGLSNLASAVVQGMPVGAGFSAGSASEAAGAATRMTALVAALALAALVAFAAPLVAHLPESVLAAVVIAALTHALSLTPFIRLWQLNRDVLLAASAAIAVIIFGVLNGMLIAIGLSIALVMQRLASPRVAKLGRLGKSHDFVDVTRHDDAQEIPDLAIWRPSVPVLFANADSIFRFIGNDALARAELKGVIVSLEESIDLDSTSFEVIAAFDASMTKMGKELRLARVHDAVRDVLAAGGLQTLTARCSYSVDDAVAALTKKTHIK